MAIRGSSTRMTAPAAAKVTRALRPFRHKLMGASQKSGGSIAFSSMAPRWGTASDRPPQELGQDVDDDGHDKQSQTHFDQGAKIKVARGLAELVRDYTGHGVAGSKQGPCDFRPIADHHGDGHGLAQREIGR